jgi:carboxylate-amine ligase
VFRRFPRSGIPDQFESWSAYEDYVNTLVELHCIDNGRSSGGTLRRIRSSARWSSASATCPRRRADDRARGAAQAIVVKLYRLRRSNLGFRIYPRALSKRTSGAPRATASTGG